MLTTEQIESNVIDAFLSLSTPAKMQFDADTSDILRKSLNRELSSTEGWKMRGPMGPWPGGPFFPEAFQMFIGANKSQEELTVSAIGDHLAYWRYRGALPSGTGDHNRYAVAAQAKARRVADPRSGELLERSTYVIVYFNEEDAPEPFAWDMQPSLAWNEEA